MASSPNKSGLRNSPIFGSVSLDEKSIYPPGLTFAEAYLLQKAKEADLKQRKGENRTLVSNLEEFHQVMKKIKNDIKGCAPPKQIKQTLKAISPNFIRYISDWYDEDQLNILQLAIIHNNPSLVNFLLVDTSFFPEKHTPPLNPYAHLAAMTGHIECLRAVLQHRPGWFFVSHQPHHAVKLPDYLLKKLRLSEKPGTPKIPNRLLAKIKMTSRAAEKKLKETDSAGASDITVLLNREMGDVEKAFKKKNKHINVNTVRGYSKKSNSSVKKERTTPDSSKKDGTREVKSKSLMLTAPVIPARPSITKWPDSSKSLQTKQTAKTELDRNHFIRRLTPGHRGHLITVFWDVASRFDDGVVQGAGQKIKVQYAPNSHLKPESPCINIKDSPGIIRWPSSSTWKSKSSVKKSSLAGSNTVNRKASKTKPALKNIDFGVRGLKRYKEFQLKYPSHDQREKEDQDTYMRKTPLTYAAEKGFEDCVQLILDMVVMKRHPSISRSDPLTLATKARSPETIILLVNRMYSREDFQNAVLIAIREMLPDCLTALLSKGKSRVALFEGVNLFHILYSQCVISGNRYELMPEMTQTLISCKEDVNAHNIPNTFPMYTLINCAFNITVGKQIFFFIECLHILLENKANPHFDEQKQIKTYMRFPQTFSRKPFSSAIHCIFGSAKNSVNFFEKSYWSRLFMKKFVTTIEQFDYSQRRVLNNVLFEYMDAVCELGLDRTIVRCLLRYGANPDFALDGKYAVNVYFDKMLPFMTKFEMINSYQLFHQELDTLMIICKSMSLHHLHQVMLIFLQVKLVMLLMLCN